MAVSADHQPNDQQLSRLWLAISPKESFYVNLLQSLASVRRCLVNINNNDNNKAYVYIFIRCLIYLLIYISYCKYSTGVLP